MFRYSAKPSVLATTRFSTQWAWAAALACFVLAAATGAWYRFAVMYGINGGLSLTDIRHAHSHLMYFGWATPALFALIVGYIGRHREHRPGGGVRWIIGATIAAALLAYPSFLLFGYRPMRIGMVRLPLSVIASSLNMIIWYVFVGWYVHSTRHLERGRPLLLFDLSLAFLVLATIGAWGLALLQPLGIDDPVWTASLTHLFLDLFSEGWFVLGVLGLAYAYLGPAQQGAHWSLWMIAAGLPFTYALGMPESLVSPVMQNLARLGSLMAAAGFFMLLWPVAHQLNRASRTRRWLWGVPLALLTIKLIAQVVVSVTPALWWADLHGVRILYLHVMLLGFVSLGLVGAARNTWGRGSVRGLPVFYGAVMLVLFSLAPLTTLWPAGSMGLWALPTATWAAPLPALAALAMEIFAVCTRQETPQKSQLVSM